jgi:hypothetical protein
VFILQEPALLAYSATALSRCLSCVLLPQQAGRRSADFWLQIHAYLDIDLLAYPTA